MVRRESSLFLWLPWHIIAVSPDGLDGAHPGSQELCEDGGCCKFFLREAGPKEFLTITIEESRLDAPLGTVTITPSLWLPYRAVPVVPLLSAWVTQPASFPATDRRHCSLLGTAWASVTTVSWTPKVSLTLPLLDHTHLCVYVLPILM